MKTQLNTLIAAISIAIFGIVSMPATASDDVRERVKKVGKLNIGGTAPAPAAAPAAPAAPAAADTTEASAASAETASAPAAAIDPAALYQTSCFACHGTGAAGSPILGDAAAWAPRIAKGEEALMTSVLNGLNAMPPRGASTFSDEELGALVKYMVESSQ